MNLAFALQGSHESIMLEAQKNSTLNAQVQENKLVTFVSDRLMEHNPGHNSILKIYILRLFIFNELFVIQKHDVSF